MSFAQVMKEANKVIRPVGYNAKFACKDVLVIRREGPKHPCLTVVDLPGLVDQPADEKTDEDLHIIEHLTEEYMKNKKRSNINHHHLNHYH